jgi:putative Mg2+ transporter-C (MgtC) family protein
MSETASQWQFSLLHTSWEFVFRVTLAALLGGAIGLEREWHRHPAGLRTNILVAIGSCLFTVLSIEGFPLRGAAQDTARIAAQIVSGIGFLGAGAVIQTRHRTRGLTTAATIWLVAALGMAVGTGAYLLAVYSTALVGAVLVLLQPLGRWIESQSPPPQDLASGEESSNRPASLEDREN